MPDEGYLIPSDAPGSGTELTLNEVEAASVWIVDTAESAMYDELVMVVKEITNDRVCVCCCMPFWGDAALAAPSVCVCMQV